MIICSKKIAKRLTVAAAHYTTASILGLTMGLAWTGGASAAAQVLDCVLTNPGNQASGQSIVVTFDNVGKTLKAQRGTESYSFTNVSISNISISGQGNGVSLGIDRSSLGMVWQQYGTDKVVTEFGRCRVSEHPNSTDSH